MDIKEYQERVINHFKPDCAAPANATMRADNCPLPLATEEDWKILGTVMLAASENGDENMEEFDKRILTKEEFAELYNDDFIGLDG